jgi:hypothetical protein
MVKGTLSGLKGIVALVAGVGFGLIILFAVIIPIITRLIVGLAPLYRMVVG